MLGPGDISGAPTLLLGLMVLAAAFAGIFAFTRQVITRTEGFVLIAIFVVYVLASL